MNLALRLHMDNEKDTNNGSKNSGHTKYDSQNATSAKSLINKTITAIW